MAPDLKSQAADNFDLSPSFSRNSPLSLYSPFGSATHEDWMKNTAYGEHMNFVDSCDPDGRGHGRDIDLKDSDEDVREQLHTEEHALMDVFVEQCQASDCFFGCGGHHTSPLTSPEHFYFGTGHWGHRPSITRRMWSGGHYYNRAPVAPNHETPPRSTRFMSSKIPF